MAGSFDFAVNTLAPTVDLELGNVLVVAADVADDVVGALADVAASALAELLDPDTRVDDDGIGCR